MQRETDLLYKITCTKNTAFNTKNQSGESACFDAFLFSYNVPLS